MITIKIIIISCRQKTQYFVHLSFNLTFQLNNDISSDLQKLLKYFTGIAVVAFLAIQLAWVGLGWAINNLALHSKDLRLLSLAILA